MAFIAHAIELRPTAAQEQLFRRACGTARFAYNWALARWNEQYKAGKKPNWVALQKDFVRAIDDEHPWVRLGPSTAYNQPFRHVNQAFKGFFKKTRKYPRFKSKHRGDDSFKLATVRFPAQLIAELPVIGSVRLAEPSRFPDARVVSATVRRNADRWELSIQYEIESIDRRKTNTGSATVGIDLGLTSFAALSTGEDIAPPKPLAKARKRLRRAQKALARKRKGSRNRTKARMQVARIHRRIKNQRSNFLHTLTTRLVRENQTLVIEDLNVKGMLQNRCLSRAISDVGWGEFRRQLEYKAVYHGRTLYLANRFFASSKQCRKCGEKNNELSLKDRTFVCPSCGHTEPRDVHAARNLRTLALGETNARGQLKALVLNGNVQD